MNIESYNAVLRGRFLIRKQTKQDTARGIAVIEEALKLDPGYAPAWAELALGYINYLNNGWIPPNEAYTAARKAVDRASRLIRIWRVPTMYCQSSNGVTTMMSSPPRLNSGGPANWSPTQQAMRKMPLRSQPLRVASMRQYARFRRKWNTIRLTPGVWVSWLKRCSAANRLPEAERVVRNLLELEPNFASGHCVIRGGDAG